MTKDICKASAQISEFALQISRGKSLYPSHKELRLNARFLYFCYKGVAGIVFETCKPLKSTVYLIPAITEVLKAGESLLIELSIFSWRNPKRFLKGPIKVAHT